MLAPPEGYRGGHAVRVLHQDAVGAHLRDPPRVGPEEEDVAGQALGDELLVEGADLQIGVGDVDVVEPRVRDRAARRQREQAAPAAGVQAVVDAVPEDARRGPPYLRGPRPRPAPPHPRRTPPAPRPGPAR